MMDRYVWIIIALGFGLLVVAICLETSQPASYLKRLVQHIKKFLHR